MIKYPNHIYNTLPENRSFLIRVDENEAINSSFHFHEDYELTLVESGYGSRFVGNHMVNFTTGDLVLVGSNVPHCWKFDQNVTHASLISIQFQIENLGYSFLSRPELRHIYEMLTSCKSGLVLKGLLRSHITSNIHRLLIEIEPFSQIMQLMHIIHLVSKSDEKDFLSAKDLSVSIYDQNDQKMVKVFSYIQDHFHLDISLEDAAAEAGLSVNAFCKFFKRTTQKTFIQTVTEYRMDYSKQLLLTTDLQMGEVAYNSGYSDISHFFRTFKKSTGFSPLKYRQAYKKNVDYKNISYLSNNREKL